MSTLPISGARALKDAWEVYKKHWAFCMGAFFLAWLCVTAPAILTGILNWFVDSVFLTFIGNFAQYFLQIWLELGFIALCLSLRENVRPKISILFSQGSLLIPAIIASFLYCLIVVAGFILLIIPGLIWLIQYGFFLFNMVEEKTQAIESLKMSSRITAGQKWNISVAIFVATVINLAGLLAFGIGVFFTLPLSILAVVNVYKQAKELYLAKAVTSSSR